jgi:Protein of unknown function (DUF3102)
MASQAVTSVHEAATPCPLTMLGLFATKGSTDKMLQRTPAHLLEPTSQSNVTATLADKANACHLAACRAANDSVRFATEAGKALLEAKQIVGHGRWLQWVKKNLTFTDRTARYYMQLANLPETRSETRCRFEPA